MRDGVALVTGAGGLVGREVVAALRRRGTLVRAGVRTASAAGRREAPGGLDTVRIDQRDERSVRGVQVRSSCRSLIADGPDRPCGKLAKTMAHLLVDSPNP